jgi:hypothetical protein
MDSERCVARCTARLYQQWPRLPPDQLREVAEELRREVERQVNNPGHAAIDWLRRGIPMAQRPAVLVSVTLLRHSGMRLRPSPLWGLGRDAGVP